MCQLLRYTTTECLRFRENKAERPKDLTIVLLCMSVQADIVPELCCSPKTTQQQIEADASLLRFHRRCQQRRPRQATGNFLVLVCCLRRKCAHPRKCARVHNICVCLCPCKSKETNPFISCNGFFVTVGGHVASVSLIPRRSAPCQVHNSSWNQSCARCCQT